MSVDGKEIRFLPALEFDRRAQAADRRIVRLRATRDVAHEGDPLSGHRSGDIQIRVGTNPAVRHGESR